MKAGGIVALNLVLTVGVVAAAHALLPPPAAHAPAPAAAPAAPAADLRERLGKAEAHLGEMQATLDRILAELAADRAAADAARASAHVALEKERERATAAEVLLAGYTGDPAKKPELDAFANQVSKAMKQGLSQEFRRVSDLVTNPTPEALEQRRRQLKIFAAAMGASAGLDQAQVAIFEGILNDTDERVREDLRPVLQGVEDYRKIDYGRVRTITNDTFAVQNERIDRDLPKEKSERLKQQLEPVRTVFGAMIDELERQSAAAAAGATDPAAPK